MKDNVENVRLFSTNPSTCTDTIFANLKHSKNECLKMQKASNVFQSIGLHGNLEDVSLHLKTTYGSNGWTNPSHF